MQLVLQAHRSSGADVVIMLVTSTACGATTFFKKWRNHILFEHVVSSSSHRAESVHLAGNPSPAQTVGELQRVAMVTGHGRHPQRRKASSLQT